MPRYYLLKRLGKTEDVAGTRLFLASDEADWIALVVDGGFSCSSAASAALETGGAAALAPREQPARGNVSIAAVEGPL